MATATERKLSDYQVKLIKLLKRKPHTSTETVELLNKQAARSTRKTVDNYTFHGVHSALRRLEDRGYVRRTYSYNDTFHKEKVVWELTKKAHQLLA